jgi:hypothetical protein
MREKENPMKLTPIGKSLGPRAKLVPTNLPQVKQWEVSTIQESLQTFFGYLKTTNKKLK